MDPAPAGVTQAICWGGWSQKVMAVLKVSLFYNWTYLKIKRDILAEHILHTVPAQTEISSCILS